MFSNTDDYRRAAIHFEKHGFYCGDPPGTAAYHKYWSEELRRCKEGYSVGGRKITGHHYFYLNYTRIKLTDGIKRSQTKVLTFPKFWDGDYEYFWLVEVARHGMSLDAFNALGLYTTVKEEFLDGGRHLIVGKARRKGFSYKNASMCANIYNTEKNSYTLIGAFDKKYLYPKGTFTMATNNLNFLNEHTAWVKRRQAIDKQNHKKASYYLYENGSAVEKGYMSEIEAITFKDNPDAARGKDANLILFEECGAFDNLKASFAATKPSVEDGGIVTGQMILFGTGGDMEGGTVDFESMFYNPTAYDLLPISNIWDDQADHLDCGLFFPCYQNKIGYMDNDGNSFKEKAIQSEEIVREQKKRDSKDGGVLDRYITEYPFKPKEAFLQHSSNIFPTAALLDWRNHLSATGIYKSLGVAGTIVETKDGLKFRPQEKARPVYKFPVQKGDDVTGAVVVYQTPYSSNGLIPNDLYIIVHDPYAQDGGGLSLGAAYVIKRVNPYSQPDNMIVASYIGRPDTQDEYNNMLFLLAKYYNARIGFENDRGEVIPYAKRYKLMHYLMPESDIFDKKDNVRIKALGRSYGTSMGSKQRKDQAEIYLRDWLREPRGISDDGEKKMNLHYIYDIALIDELLKYNRTGNFDRVSALLVGMFHMKDLHSREITAVEEQTTESFWDRSFFS